MKDDLSPLMRRLAEREKGVLEPQIKQVVAKKVAEYLSSKVDPAASLEEIKIRRVLLGLRLAMVDAEVVASKDVTALRASVRKQLAPLIEKGKLKIDYGRLGCKSAEQVAELLVQTAIDVGYGKYSLAQLRRGGRGLLNYFRGKLNELYFIAHGKLVKEVLKKAESDVQDLNAMLGAKKVSLPNVRGKPVEFDGRVTLGADGSTQTPQFGSVRTATKIFLIMEDGTRKEYTDLMHVAEFDRGDGAKTNQFVAMTAVEFKAGPASAKGLRSQIGSAQVRVEGAKQVEILLDNKETRVIDVENLILSPAEFNRIGIAPGKVNLLAQGDDWTIASTERGGYLETFIQITAAVDVSPLTSLSNLLYHAMGMRP